MNPSNSPEPQKPLRERQPGEGGGTFPRTRASRIPPLGLRHYFGDAPKPGGT